MKRFLALLLAVLLLSGCGLQGCFGPPTPPSKVEKAAPPEAVAPGTNAPARDCVIAQVDGDALLLYDEGGTLYTLALTGLLLTGQDESILSDDDLAAGQRVSVFFDGAVTLSNPAFFTEPTKLIVRGETTDLLGMYLNLFDALWVEDAGLNDGISVLAFQFSDTFCGLPLAPPSTPAPAVASQFALTQAQKNALLYILQHRYGYESFESDHDALLADGYIVKEENGFAHFPGGLLIELRIEEDYANGFRFSFSKWRSGLGAYIFTDCEATCADGTWSYTIGPHAIA